MRETNETVSDDACVQAQTDPQTDGRGAFDFHQDLQASKKMGNLVVLVQNHG